MFFCQFWRLQTLSRLAVAVFAVFAVFRRGRGRGCGRAFKPRTHKKNPHVNSKKILICSMTWVLQSFFSYSNDIWISCSGLFLRSIFLWFMCLFLEYSSWPMILAGFKRSWHYFHYETHPQLKKYVSNIKNTYMYNL